MPLMLPLSMHLLILKASSRRKNMPEIMSLTSVWAPKPTATPTTPAPAMSGQFRRPDWKEPSVRPLRAGRQTTYCEGSEATCEASHVAAIRRSTASPASFCISLRSIDALAIRHMKLASRMMTKPFRSARCRRVAMVSLAASARRGDAAMLRKRIRSERSPYTVACYAVSKEHLHPLPSRAADA